jgi:hypothetical protein
MFTLSLREQADCEQLVTRARRNDHRPPRPKANSPGSLSVGRATETLGWWMSVMRVGAENSAAGFPRVRRVHTSGFTRAREYQTAPKLARAWARTVRGVESSTRFDRKHGRRGCGPNALAFDCGRGES